MTSITWNAEGGTDGVAISTGNSGGASGTAWDLVQRGTNATNEFDSATAANGTYSALMATGATSTTAHLRWAAAIIAAWPSGMTTHYGRCYVRTAALPSVDRSIVELLDATATTNRANIRIRSTGTVRLRNAANGTVATTTTVLSIDTWYRIEWRIDGSTTGAYELHLFAGNSATPLESIVGGTADFGGAIGAINFGFVSNAANIASLWLDGIEVNDTGLPGPEDAGVSGIAPNGIAAVAALGEPSVALNLSAVPDSVAVTAAPGQPTVIIPSVSPNGIAVSVVLGEPTVTIPSVTADGIAVTAALGTPTVGDTAPERNLQLTVGSPQAKWRAGPPAVNWKAGAPGSTWRAGAPRT